MASPGNQHCANCIGTLSFPISSHNDARRSRAHSVRTVWSINQSVNHSSIFRVVQVIKSLQDPLEVGNNLPGTDDNVRERGLEQKCFKRWRKVDRDGADITLSGRLFQMVGPATGKARPQTVDSFTDHTSRRLVRAERRERCGWSSTEQNWRDKWWMQREVDCNQRSLHVARLPAGCSWGVNQRATDLGPAPPTHRADGWLHRHPQRVHSIMRYTPVQSLPAVW